MFDFPSAIHLCAIFQVASLGLTMEDAAAADIINEFSSDGEGIDDFIEEDDSPECQLQKEITKKV